MKSGAAHSSFLDFVRQREQAAEAHRVGGEGCCWLRVRVRPAEELSAFLDESTQLGNYRVSLSNGRVK